MRKHSGFLQRISNGMRLNSMKKVNANNRTDNMSSLSAITVIVSDNDVLNYGNVINRQSTVIYRYRFRIVICACFGFC